MKQLALTALGYTLSRKPVFWTIKKLARPHVHLFDLNGPMYMGRWSVIDEFVRVNNKDTKVRTTASKVLEYLTGYSSIRLHWIRRADHDREKHNHPFSYRTFILAGLYAEEFEEPHVSDDGGCGMQSGYRFVHRGQTATGNFDKFHRIDLVPTEGVWTLFCMTKNTNEWGFRDASGEYHRSARYFRMKGYGKQHRGVGEVKQ
jgi:hypothetical protein